MNDTLLISVIDNQLQQKGIGGIPTMMDVKTVIKESFSTIVNLGFVGTEDDAYNIYAVNRLLQMTPTLTMLNNTTGWYQTWLTKNPNRGKFWNDYKDMLSRKLSSKAIVAMDDITNNILDQLANPINKGTDWYKAGLVVGHVQSGKTGNFIGLANKAIDAGFKMIIILSGLTTDLRRQTQIIVDNGIIGRDTSTIGPTAGNPIGVGTCRSHPNVISLTSADLDGDFRQNAKVVSGYLRGTDPIVMVCKKNPSVLRNLLKIFSQAARQDDGLPILNDLPILIIDDECDNASVNTSPDDVTAINALIRCILAMFSQRAYVAYTATPFANIFITPSDTYPGGRYGVRNGNAPFYRIGQDLFPNDFILNLGAPANYIGPDMLFGIDSVADPSKPSRPLKIFENITDLDQMCEGPIKANTDITNIPDSLKNAICCFFVATAIRRARGQKGKHSSMLINATQYRGPQYQIYQNVLPYVEDCCRKLITPGANTAFYNYLQTEIYDKILKQSNKDAIAFFTDRNMASYAAQLTWKAWDDVKEELKYVGYKILRNGGDTCQVRVINSDTNAVNVANREKLD